MPTKKPRIQSILEIETHEKLKYICEQEMRTESQMVNYIITKYIDEYENKNGHIKNLNIIDNKGTINM